MQATYAEPGIAEADLVQAGRLTNPHFAYLRTARGDERKVEWALTFPVIDLLTIPLRTRIENRRFEQVKVAVAGQMLDVATRTRKSWVGAVAAEERIRYFEQVKTGLPAAMPLPLAGPAIPGRSPATSWWKRTTRCASGPPASVSDAGRQSGSSRETRARSITRWCLAR
ncbi:MAG: hypothetical protein HZA60_04685 [Deltaproteobacteria bacterium]|nr:hypothetical protein [Deltaproteobacteria bacterium]